jgi:hypothetical protein
MNDLGTEVQATEALKPEVGLGETERDAEKKGGAEKRADAEESGAEKQADAEESGAEKQAGAEESGAEKRADAEESGAEESGVFLGGEESKTVLVFDLMTGAALDHDAKSQVVLQMTGI